MARGSRHKAKHSGVSSEHQETFWFSKLNNLVIPNLFFCDFYWWVLGCFFIEARGAIVIICKVISDVTCFGLLQHLLLC